MNKDICIVSVGLDGREQYSKFASILESQATKNGYPCMVWKNSYPPNSPTHQEIPYAFKPFAIKAARDAGYNKVLWADCKCYIQKELVQINDSLENDGYWFVYDGGTIGEWCKDECLPIFGITREMAFEIPVIAAKHFALNFNKTIANDFFTEYMNYATENNGVAYRGPWTNKNNEASNDPRVRGHRHDQTCASRIVNKLNMTILKNNCVDWRDGWKFKEMHHANRFIDNPEILFDGYLHGTHTCNCEGCVNAFNEVKENKRHVPDYFLR